jgi:hypothetical protein
VNLDFSHHALFSTYVVLLAVSGVLSLTFASPAFSRTSRLLRGLNFVVGIGFIGYAFYLAFLFHGGTYVIFFKAFILPGLLIIRTVASGRGPRRTASTSPAFTPYNPALGNPAPPAPVGSGVPLVAYSYPMQPAYQSPPSSSVLAPTPGPSSGRHAAPVSDPASGGDYS